jgi:hypothetical protein
VAFYFYLWTMASSNSVYEEVQFLCNKYHHGYVAPDEFVSTFNTAQRIFINRILGQVQEYQPGRPVARTGGHMTQVVEEKLAPFTKRVTATFLNEVSRIKDIYPDFLKLLSLNTEDGTRVRRIKHEQIHSALKSAIDPPSSSNPYYYEYDEGFRILSGTDDLDTMIMTYIRKPADITWPYNIVGGVPTYSASGANGGPLQNPEWRDQEINELIFIQLGLIGINLKDADLIRVSQTAKQQGE